MLLSNILKMRNNACKKTCMSWFSCFGGQMGGNKAMKYSSMMNDCKAGKNVIAALCTLAGKWKEEH